MIRNYAYNQEHCQHRFRVLGLPNASKECGEGKRGLKNTVAK
jgi:hypothetical protein